MKNILIIDGNNLSIRSFYSNKTKEGREDVFYSTLSRIKTLINGRKDVVFVFDNGEKNFRHEIYPEYKANRNIEDDGRYEFISDMISNLSHLYKVYSATEADDGIYTLCQNNKNQNIYIFSTDQDMYGLINNNIKVISVIKKQYLIIDSNYVIQNLGISPEKIYQYKAIVGDNSDNIKGAYGIGSKRALPLIKEYGSIDNIYKNINNIKPQHVREKLIESVGDVYLSLRLTTPILIDEMKDIIL